MATPDPMYYEVQAVRYGTLRTSKAELFHRHESYGEPDAEIEMAIEALRRTPPTPH